MGRRKYRRNASRSSRIRRRKYIQIRDHSNWGRKLFRKKEEEVQQRKTKYKIAKERSTRVTPLLTVIARDAIDVFRFFCLFFLTVTSNEEYGDKKIEKIQFIFEENYESKKNISYERKSSS